jgi:hypothetical protein
MYAPRRVDPESSLLSPALVVLLNLSGQWGFTMRGFRLNGWQRIGIILSVIWFVFGLTGCFDGKDVQRDLAACKVRAIEVYKPASLISDDRAGEYIKNCMITVGYRLASDCLDKQIWTYVGCYE